jgi:hypothetical protein
MKTAAKKGHIVTLHELKHAFPLGCEVRLTAAAKAQGCTRTFRGTTGKVEGYGHKTDLAGNPVFFLTLWLDGYKRRLPCSPSHWEQVGGGVPR